MYEGYLKVVVSLLGIVVSRYDGDKVYKTFESVSFNFSNTTTYCIKK